MIHLSRMKILDWLKKIKPDPAASSLNTASYDLSKPTGLLYYMDFVFKKQGKLIKKKEARESSEEIRLSNEFTSYVDNEILKTLGSNDKKTP